MMAQAPGQLPNPNPQENENHLNGMFAPAAANNGPVLQAAAANGDPPPPPPPPPPPALPPHLPPVYANLIVALLQSAAAQGVNLLGGPLPQHPAGNDHAIGAILQAADGNQARRRAAGNERGDASGNGRGDERRSAAGQETFSEQIAKAKSVLTQPFIFASLVYSLVISFSLSVRGNQMSLVNGRPVDSIAHAFMVGPDKWSTTSSMGLLIACVAFLVILMTHFYLISHLTMRRPAGSPAMQRYCSSVVPITLTLATELYYLCYMSLSRYEVDTREWIILGVFSAVLICGSANIIICSPIRQEQVVVTQRVHVV